MRDFVADQVENQRLGRALANQGHLHMGAFRPLEHVGDFFRTQVVGRLPVDGGDDVAGTNAGAVGWRSLKRKDHNDLLRGADSLRLDRHSDAVVLAVLVFAHLRVGLGVVEAGVRIEGAQHSRDRAVVNHLAGLVAGQRIGVVLRDDVVDTGEGA